MAEQLAFQLDDGGSTPTSPLWRIDGIQHTEAKQFVERWHYSKRMPTGKNICFGLRYAGKLYAVAVYGIGVNPYQAEYLSVQSVVELKRMCRREPREEYQLSRFIRLTWKMLLRQHPYDALVAFADPAQGHEGTVYKAAGFAHNGMTNAEWHVIDKDGNLRHRRFVQRTAERRGIPIGQAREDLGVTRVRVPAKHRWVLYR